MAYQFIHYEKYKLTDLEGIIGEVTRAEKYSPHVENPKDCIEMYGSIKAFKERLEREVPSFRRQVLKANRYGSKLVDEKLKSNANVFLCGVASFHIRNEDITKENFATFEQWVNCTKKFLKDKYGDQLQCIVGHLDEEYPHLHFYVIPTDYDMSNACPYDKALKDFNASKDKDSKAPDTGKKLAAVEALKKYQDDYFEQVGFYVGQARMGPRRRRLTRQEWVDEQVAAGLAANCVNKTNARSAKAEKKATHTNKMVAGALAGLAVSQNADVARLTTENAALKNTIAEQDTLIGMISGLGPAGPSIDAVQTTVDRPRTPKNDLGTFGL